MNESKVHLVNFLLMVIHILSHEITFSDSTPWNLNPAMSPPVNAFSPFPGPPIGWPMRMNAPQNQVNNNFFRPRPNLGGHPLPYPLNDLGGFSPIGFEYPSQEELIQIERERKLRRERLKMEKNKLIAKRNEERPSTSSSVSSSASSSNNNDQRATTESTNNYDDKTKFDDSKYSNFDSSRERINSKIQESKKLSEKKPLEVKRKQTMSPNGQVTFITEMLYDIEGNGGNPFKLTTSPPSPNSPFMPPTTDGMYRPTDDPRTSSKYQSSNSFTTTFLPGTLSRPRDHLSNWQMLPTPPTPFRSSSSNTDQMYHAIDNNKNLNPRHRSSSSSSNQGRVAAKGSNRREYDQQVNQGLGAAAIAGIVIGSLVSVALLAGTALFIMYKSPFGKRSNGDLRAGHHLHPHPHPQSVPSRQTMAAPSSRTSNAYPVTNHGVSPPTHVDSSRVYRWPPKRCHNHSPRNTGHRMA